MSFAQVLVLALIQGFTEFLPISSSAHLALLPALTGWTDQGLAFDVAVHVGTLAAVLAYFRREIVVLWHAWWRTLRLRHLDGEGVLAWGVLWGTVPVGLAGLLFAGHVETIARNPLVIAAASIVFGLLLWAADRWGQRERDEYALGWRDIAVVGLAQALALIPGTSRSGVTMTAGRAMGLDRRAAARYSFLLAIPVIVLAGGHQAANLAIAPAAVDWLSLGLGAMLSGIVAYGCIGVFLAWVPRIGMGPFVIYRIVLGLVLVYIYL